MIFRIILRGMILLTYLAALSPWPLAYFLDEPMFVGLGIVFAVVAAALLPKAIDDWNEAWD